MKIRRVYPAASRRGKEFTVELADGQAVTVPERELYDYPALCLAVWLETGERLEEPAMAGAWEAYLGHWVPIESGV
jgi:hypothetical protein